MARESASEWFERFQDLGREPLFTLKFNLYRDNSMRVTIKAWEGPPQNNVGSYQTHTTIFCQMRVTGDKPGKPLFPRSDFWVGVTTNDSLDGRVARELVTSLFCMKPGDTDPDFFSDYTPDQLAWVNAHAESLSCEKDFRYCDPETGEVRR